MRDAIDLLLQQGIDTSLPYDKVVEQLLALAGQCQVKLTAPQIGASAPLIVGSGAPAQPGAAPSTIK
jgi:hypothetical protein